MKKLTFIFAALVMVAVMYAQQPFEGVITLKTMESYSSQIVKVMPYLYSHADVCEVKIKGNEVHMYDTQRGLHKVLKNGHLYYWSELTKTGFDMPLFYFSSTVERQWIPTDMTKEFDAVTAHKMKHVFSVPNGRFEGDCWLADENPNNIDMEVLKTIYSFLFPNPAYAVNFQDRVCYKSSYRSLTNSSTEQSVGMVPGWVGNASVAGKDKDQAANAGSDDCSVSTSFEILSIAPAEIQSSEFDIPKGIQFVSLDHQPTGIDYVHVSAEIYPFMKNILKMDKTGNATKKTAETMEGVFEDQGKPLGVTKEYMISSSYYQGREQLLLTEHKNALKKAKKLKELKSEKEAIIYDVDKEWDF